MHNNNISAFKVSEKKIFKGITYMLKLIILPILLYSNGRGDVHYLNRLEKENISVTVNKLNVFY